MNAAAALSLLLESDQQLLIDCRYCARHVLLDRLGALERFGADATLQTANDAASCHACQAASEFVWVSVATQADLDQIANPGKHLVRNGRRSAKRTAPRSKRRLSRSGG